MGRCESRVLFTALRFSHLPTGKFVTLRHKFPCEKSSESIMIFLLRTLYHFLTKCLAGFSLAYQI